MSDDSRPVTTTTTNFDLMAVLVRIEEKQDIRFRDLDSKVDRIAERQDSKVNIVMSRLDRLEGALGMLKWLGPTGVAAVIYALLKGSGLIP